MKPPRFFWVAVLLCASGCVESVTPAETAAQIVRVSACKTKADQAYVHSTDSCTAVCVRQNNPRACWEPCEQLASDALDRAYEVCDAG